MLHSSQRQKHRYSMYIVLSDNCPPCGLLKRVMHTKTFRELLKSGCNVISGVPRIFHIEEDWLHISDGRLCSYKTYYDETGWHSIMKIGTILNVKETLYYIEDEKCEDRFDAGMILTVIMMTSILLVLIVLELVARKCPIMLLDFLCVGSIAGITILAAWSMSAGKIVGRWRNILLTNHLVYVGIFLLVLIALHVSPRMMMILYVLTAFIFPMIILDMLYIRIRKLHFLSEFIIEGDKNVISKIVVELMSSIRKKFFFPASHIVKKIKEKFHIDLAEEWKKWQKITQILRQEQEYNAT